MAAKKQLVKLKLQLEFLKTLPAFTPPKPKRVKKVGEDKKNGNGALSASKGTSPAPNEEAHSHRTTSAHKEMSTAGLTVNSVNQILDKSGTPCKKWVRSTQQFKTFSGFQVKLKSWKHKLDGRVKHEDRVSVSELVEPPQAPVGA